MGESIDPSDCVIPWIRVTPLVIRVQKFSVEPRSMRSEPIDLNLISDLKMYFRFYL